MYGAGAQQYQESSEEKKQERKWFWAYPQIEGVPPCARGGHSATLIGASILYFGGHYYGGKKSGYVYLNDTHVLDLNSSRWIKPKIQGTPPKPRYGHTAILAGSRIIIFGGKGNKGEAFRDLHALDPVTMTWYQGPEGAGAPLARFGHTANLVGGTKMYVLGGWNGKEYYSDLFILDLEKMAWQQPQTTGPEPSPRHGHSSILIGNNLVVHGGFKLKEDQLKTCGLNQGGFVKASYLDDIRVLDTDSFIWSRLRISGSPPDGRYGHTMNISGSEIILFGGWTSQSGSKTKPIAEESKDHCDYFMVWNTELMAWKQGKYVGNAPTARYGHTSTAIGPHLLIFGGWELSKAQNEIIVLREFTSSGATGGQGLPQNVQMQ
ncbi:hypothetical protein FGO68_gene5245 [Halteria grandinella]|uniref:Uncharacterized protein n=1 Tax=Halteria grandinella TaxID=5974 RepID=A0A8J8T185_HALGN|nr:hypothetical protein FGO68_gene5245 [Halteria grandinella]